MIVIADSGGANINSIRYAFERIGQKTLLSRDADIIYNADRVIIPGVGAAIDSMSRLHKLEIIDVLKKLERPCLGICIGMQLLFNSSEEGHVDLLGLIPDDIRKLKSSHLPIPHMGWNQVSWSDANNPLNKGIDNHSHFYYVHSYGVSVNPAWTIGSTNYGTDFSAAIQKNNYFGVQFHPEKSANNGSLILRNFSKL